MSEYIEYTVDRGVGWITLNRPDRYNALSYDMMADLEEILWDADTDMRVHCVVIRGAGKGFCSGADLSGFSAEQSNDAAEIPRRSSNDTIDDDIWNIERFSRHLRTLWEMHKPSIAQVHGACLAMGSELALSCDLVIVADDARMGFPPARDLGALPNNLWVYHCGPQWSKRLQLTGDTITGEEAAHIGLALKSVPAECLSDEVEGLALRLAQIDPDLLSANKRSINLAMELMGARTLQRITCEIDARGHLARSAQRFPEQVQKFGLKQALQERDAPFGDGRARVLGPEIRDENGYLV